MSINLALDASLPNAVGTATDFTVTINPPIVLGSLDYAVALTHLDTWFTSFNVFPNSTVVWGNTGITGPGGPGPYAVTVPVPAGNYAIQDINSLLIESEANQGAFGTIPPGVLAYGVELVPNFNTNLVEVVINNSIGPTGTAYFLNMGATGALTELMGLDPQFYLNTTQGQHTPDFNQGQNQWQIRLDLVRNSYSNGTEQPILYQFVPQVPPSAHITIDPFQLIYIQVNKSLINQIHVTLTDQLGRIIDLNGNLLTVNVKIKRIGAFD